MKRMQKYVYLEDIVNLGQWHGEACARGSQAIVIHIIRVLVCNKAFPTHQ